MTPIRHISTSTIRPTNGDDDELNHRSIELTPWDLRLIQIDYIQKGLLFKKSAKREESSSLIDHLKSTLSRTLNNFYPLAGRLALTKNDNDNTCSFFINCNGNGAEFVHAAADGVKVEDILDSVYFADDIVNHLFCMMDAWNYEGITKPLVAVQVTELVDGIFIGCSINHVVVDGTSFWHFFNTWSEISHVGPSGKISQPRPVFAREFYDGVIDLPIQLSFSNIQEIMTKKPLIRHGLSSPNSSQRVVFHFRKEKVVELKSKANVELGTTDNNTISSLQALMAHLWRAVTRARNLNPDQEVSYRIAVGVRQRMELPLPKEYIGNGALGLIVKCTAGELVRHGLGWAAFLINKKIGSLKAEEARKYMEDWVKAPTFLSNPQRDTATLDLLTGSSSRFNVYGNDFGWGRPVAVRSRTQERKVGKLTVFPGPEEGSIDFECCLWPETIRAMAEDVEFMQAMLT
ncbi:hypothetical protein ACFX15_018179 [Malus domestica]